MVPVDTVAQAKHIAFLFDPFVVGGGDPTLDPVMAERFEGSCQVMGIFLP